MNVSLLITSVWRLSQMSQSIFLVRAIVCLISQGREENEFTPRPSPPFENEVTSSTSYSFVFQSELFLEAVISNKTTYFKKRVYFIFIILSYMYAFVCLHVGIAHSCRKPQRPEDQIAWNWRYSYESPDIDAGNRTLVFGKSSKCFNH